MRNYLEKRNNGMRTEFPIFVSSSPATISFEKKPAIKYTGYTNVVVVGGVIPSADSGGLQNGLQKKRQ